MPRTEHHQTGTASENSSLSWTPAAIFRKCIDFTVKYRLYFEIVLMAVIILCGILFRFDDLDRWKKNNIKAFYNNEPIHTTFDAWFYLSLAQDLLDGTYHAVDERRGVPDSPNRPVPPPLISILAAACTKVSGLSLSWIGAMLPALLGPLLSIPLFLLGRLYGGTVCGLTAAFVALLYPFYIHRSNLGRFDTDCMNVTFAVAAAYISFMFARAQSLRRYGYVMLFAVIFVLYLWWWDQAPAAVAAIALLPAAVALVFFYRPSRKEAVIFYSILGAGIVGLFVITGFDTPLRIVNSLWTMLRYIAKDQTDIFPNIGVTISEQSRPSFELIVAYTTKNVLSFLCAAAGLCLLVWQRFRQSLFLISFFVLSFLTFTTANRFLIFLIPLLALGTGYFFSYIWRLRTRFVPLAVIVPVLVIACAVPLYSANKSFTQWPKENGFAVEGMHKIRSATPENAVVWAWWDHGYALTYYARRATINDGSIHSGRRTVYTAIPFTTDSFRLAANFMHFYVIHGMSGISKFSRACGSGQAHAHAVLKKILAAGPDRAAALIRSLNLKPISGMSTEDEWLGFFFPSGQRPVYLFVDNLLTKIAYWWYWFGTWDIEKKDGVHPVYKLFYNIRLNKTSITGSDGLSVDTTAGKATSRGSVFPLAALGLKTDDGFREKNYYRSSRFRFEAVPQKQYGALLDTGIAESVFNKLFIRHVFNDRFFRPVAIRSPHYQIWEVVGETYHSGGS